MHKITFNFAKQSIGHINKINAILMVLALSLLAALVIFTKRIEMQYIEQKESLDAQKPKQPIQQINPAFQETLGYALETKDKLNFQWLSLLSHLESVKASNENVYFLSVEPNKAKADIMISGEAKQFENIVQLISAIKARPIFTDAVLVNHYLVVDPVESQNQEVVYHFNLRVNWK
jgi:hypothetical protein